MTNYLVEAEKIAPELIALRREFHRDPEMGNQEFHTAARIEACLNGWGIPTRRLLDTAVVGRLEGGKPGPVAALRSDMDALPLQEATGCDFASQNAGVMHACGHDVHMAAALGAARLLAARREELPGAVVFLFQPDAEGWGGAQRMIDAGALEGVVAQGDEAAAGGLQHLLDVLAAGAGGGFRHHALPLLLCQADQKWGSVCAGPQ